MNAFTLGFFPLGSLLRALLFLSIILLTLAAIDFSLVSISLKAGMSPLTIIVVVDVVSLVIILAWSRQIRAWIYRTNTRLGRGAEKTEKEHYFKSTAKWLDRIEKNLGKTDPLTPKAKEAVANTRAAISTARQALHNKSLTAVEAAVKAVKESMRQVLKATWNLPEEAEDMTRNVETLQQECLDAVQAVLAQVAAKSADKVNLIAERKKLEEIQAGLAELNVRSWKASAAMLDALVKESERLSALKLQIKDIEALIKTKTEFFARLSAAERQLKAAQADSLLSGCTGAKIKECGLENDCAAHILKEALARVNAMVSSYPKASTPSELPNTYKLLRAHERALSLVASRRSKKRCGK